MALLGPAVADPDALTGLVDDDLPLDDSEEAQLEWEQVQAEWIATGFPGCEPAFPVAKDQPRAVDEGFVIVEPDEVKTKAQPSTGRKEVWTFTAVVLVAGLRYAFAEATAEGLWLQVSALLLQLGVLSGERRLLVLGDGAAWIRAWFESLGISLQAMILCWWHLRKRCYESMSSAGGPKDLRHAFEKELLGQLWEGKVNAAIELLKGALEWVRNPAAVEELIAYLEKRRAYIPNYGMVQERPFSGNTWDLSADPDRSRALQRVYASPWLPCWGFSSARTACTPEVPASERAAHPSATPRGSCRPDWGLHCAGTGGDSGRTEATSSSPSPTAAAGRSSCAAGC